ncbi:MAG TPA: hypothetical protein VK537_08510 [Galbitalea sp.]|nr:hypothetical protein [Galbitalea sp.]
MQTTIPYPSPFITSWLVGDECRDLMQSEILRALALWKLTAAAHARTGRELGSARTSVRIGGVHGDRYVAELLVGGADSAAPYTLSDQFGAFRRARHFQAPARDLNKVLDLMAAAT